MGRKNIRPTIDQLLREWATVIEFDPKYHTTMYNFKDEKVPMKRGDKYVALTITDEYNGGYGHFEGINVFSRAEMDMVIRHLITVRDEAFPPEPLPDAEKTLSHEKEGGA